MAGSKARARTFSHAKARSRIKLQTIARSIGTNLPTVLYRNIDTESGFDEQTSLQDDEFSSKSDLHVTCATVTHNVLLKIKYWYR